MIFKSSVKFKRITALLLCLCISVTFTACGKGTFSKKTDDGTLVKIEYTNHGFLTRAPRFEKSENYITMKFNGYEWYTVGIIGEAELKRIEKGGLIAQSSNISVYENRSEGRFPYYYVMDLEDTDSVWILFNSTDSPDSPGYGTDFDNQIKYYAGKTAVVPDTDFIIC